MSTRDKFNLPKKKNILKVIKYFNYEKPKRLKADERLAIAEELNFTEKTFRNLLADVRKLNIQEMIEMEKSIKELKRIKRIIKKYLDKDLTYFEIACVINVRLNKNYTRYDIANFTKTLKITTKTLTPNR